MFLFFLFFSFFFLFPSLYPLCCLCSLVFFNIIFLLIKKKILYECNFYFCCFLSEPSSHFYCSWLVWWLVQLVVSISGEVDEDSCLHHQCFCHGPVVEAPPKQPQPQQQQPHPQPASQLLKLVNVGCGWGCCCCGCGCCCCGCGCLGGASW